MYVKMDITMSRVLFYLFEFQFVFEFEIKNAPLMSFVALLTLFHCTDDVFRHWWCFIKCGIAIDIFATYSSRLLAKQSIIFSTFEWEWEYSKKIIWKVIISVVNKNRHVLMCQNVSIFTLPLLKLLKCHQCLLKCHWCLLICHWCSRLHQWHSWHQWHFTVWMWFKCHILICSLLP